MSQDTAVVSAAADVGARTRGTFESFLEFDGAGRSGDLIVDQLATWLRERGLEPDLSGSLTLRDGDRDLVFVRHRVRGGFDVLARLVERNPTGTWRTELVVHATDQDAGWARLSVANDEGRFVDVPRLASYVMDVVETRDGPALFSSTPQVVSGGGVDEVLDWLCDPDRRALAFVAGTDTNLPFDAFVHQVGRWTRQVRGLAHVVVLDPLATEELKRAVDTSHEVPPWTLRTFLPEVDPGWAPDGRRHKIMGTRRLGEMDDGALRLLLGRIARDHAGQRVLPPAVTRVRRSLRRLEDDLVVDGLVEVPEPTVEPAIRESAAAPAPVAPVTMPSDADLLVSQTEQYLAQIQLVKALLGVAELDEVTLRELAAAAERGRMSATAIERVRAELQEREARINRLEDEVGLWKGLFEEEEFDRSLAEETRSRVEDENRWLRQRLVQAQDFEAAYGQVPAEAYTQFPANFEILVDRIREFEDLGVVFTGDDRETRSLDDHDSAGKLVHAAWEDLLVLADYLRARRGGDFDSGLRAYVDNTPQGYRTVTRKQFAGTETAQTMKGHGDERVLPVPVEVDPSGFATMKAHFKLGQVGMVSPRLYLLDRFSVDGRVYVGYIGIHLTNTQTN